MKHIIIAIVFIFALCTNQIFPQTISNGDFENWTDNKPDGWDTSNDDIAVFGQTVVEEYTSDPFSGSSAVYLESKSMGPFIMTGIIVNGYYEFDQTLVETIQGSPFTERPDKMKFAYKCAPEAGDNCFISIALLLNSDTVANGVFTNSNLVETWTEGEIVLNYLNSDVPDTLIIMVMSSKENHGSAGQGAVAGSKLWVDNFTFETSSSVQSVDLQDGSFVHPNPTSGILNISNVQFGNISSEVNIYNALGSKILESKINKHMESNFSIDISDFPKGIYIVQLTSETENLMQKIVLK
ncbi:MAG: T9SS type A sorting domain-containing protein [Bacteroidetes bacterium]|jgi:hypothetical protein|nr:T9SS type A sorting domain-containing protein [Bacteroidota bacterium]MBT6685805.1 T9SS type A sorting domain-containing protein [Bacteroidota bacterium]MBT7143717.1 T9SS type A sorting domain-containing protein [Bacteroidota bacterium]MBT7491944.1 T9SS type A sorting domain-containing protein [Bacteroidota bacterium]